MKHVDLNVARFVTRHAASTVAGRLSQSTSPDCPASGVLPDQPIRLTSSVMAGMQTRRQNQVRLTRPLPQSSPPASDPASWRPW